MAEFDPRNLGPLGAPPDPLLPYMAQDARPKKPRLENPGVTDVGSAGMMRYAVPQEPEQLAVPDPVSATDPAFSMHPLAAPLGGLGKAPVPPSVGQGSPFSQLPPNYISSMKLMQALKGKPKLDADYQSQGQVSGI